MAAGKIKWDAEGQRFYETGVNHGVLYVWDSETDTYGDGVAWNGLSSISESPSGADINSIYADNMKYLNLVAAEEFGATVEAYTYPDEFMECDGSASLVPGVNVGQQTRKRFALSYRTEFGNDTDGVDHGYKIHIIYGCLAAPSERSYQTINDSPEAISFSWEVSTTPLTFTIDGVEYSTANVVIDSNKFGSAKMAKLEEILYGKDASGSDAAVAPRVLKPEEIAALTA